MLHDPARLAALEAAAVLDTPPDPTFDRLSQLARDALGASAAYVVLVTGDRQYMKSCARAAGPAAEGQSAPLAVSFCRFVVEASAPLRVPDARRDPAWRDYPGTHAFGIGAYLGAPIVVEGRHAIGSLCVTEPGARAWTDRDVAVLAGLADAVAREFELRAANRGLVEREAALVAAAREREAVFAAMHDVVLVIDREGTYVRVLPTAPELLYRPGEEIVGRRVHDLFPAAAADAFVAVVRRALGEGRPVTHEYALDLPGLAGGPARPTYFHGTASPLDAAAGTVLWVARDVTAERTAAAERAAAEACVREREARLDLIYNSASDLMFLMSVGEPGAGGRRAYRCVSVNAAYHAATGLADGALVGRAVEEIVPAAHAEFLRARYDEAVAGGAVLRYEERVALPAGEVHVETTLTPVRDAAGRCTHLLGAARDVTARVAAEAAVRASEARLRAMSAASPVGIFEADPAGHVRYANPRCAELWEAPEAELLGDAWQARVHVDDRAPLLAEWGAAVATGAEFARLFRLLLPAAEAGGPPRVRWVHGRAAPLRDAAGRVVGGVGTVEDVTDRQEAETTQRRLTGILEAMPDVVTVAALSGRVEYLNAAGRRLLGVRGGPQAVRAARLRVATIQPQFAPGGASAGAVAAAMVDGAWRGETTLTKCDGREIPVEQVILAHRGAGGEIEYLSSILRDVTERRQAEATLRAFALVDELTGLYNRRGFLALAEREWEAARAAGQGGVFVYLDLDGFKPVNDTYGHAEGDRALQAVAAVLRRAFRDPDVVGRLGGDEFVAFARCGAAAGGSALDGARATAARVQGRVQALLAEANLADKRPYALAASVGVALFDPAAPATLSALMVEADAALYDRKRARGRVGAAA